LVTFELENPLKHQTLKLFRLDGLHRCTMRQAIAATWR
jgi:hypothetical protein